MATKIEKKIVDFKVVKQLEDVASPLGNGHSATVHHLEHMHEHVERPDLLFGSTYKIKTPLSDHALYVTINDMVLNHGTDHEIRRPFEIFINSKNMDHFQWVVALTRVISAVFRKGGDVTFMAEEMKAVFDPKGGYFKKGGKFMPSLVAEIGDAIETHMRMIGLIADSKLDQYQQAFVDAKRVEFESNSGNDNATEQASDFPANSQLCAKCQVKASILMDGCMTCLNCGDSKCS